MPLFDALTFLAAALAAGATPPGASLAPIHLVTEPAGDGVRLMVVGAAGAPYEAHYALEVSSDSNGGRNRSVQRGAVKLQPGVPVKLVTLTLGNLKEGGWTAKLSVTPRGAEPYEEVRRSR